MEGEGVHHVRVVQGHILDKACAGARDIEIRVHEVLEVVLPGEVGLRESDELVDA